MFFVGTHADAVGSDAPYKELHSRFTAISEGNKFSLHLVASSTGDGVRPLSDAIVSCSLNESYFPPFPAAYNTAIHSIQMRLQDSSLDVLKISRSELEEICVQSNLSIEQALGLHDFLGTRSLDLRYRFFSPPFVLV